MLLRALFDLALDLVAPAGCVACDEPVRPRVVFCRLCATTLIGATSSPHHVAAYAYGGAAATAIVRFKYARRSDLGPRLGAALAQVASPLAGRVDLVVPVPLHPRRLAERGYNQAALLASPVARRLGVPHAARALERTRDTARQASMGRVDRTENVSGAFRSRADLTGLSVLLVDDVRTTGATLEACAEALSSAGARAVVTLVVARRARADEA